MRIVMPRRSLRDALSLRQSRSGFEAVVPSEVEEERLAATQALGQRQEVLTTALEGIADLASRLRGLEPLVEQLRGPLGEELATYRQDHAELVVARAHLRQLSARLQAAAEKEADLSGKLDTLRAELADLRSHNTQLDQTSQDAVLELNRVREGAQRGEATLAAASAELRDAKLQISQLEEDRAAMLAQARQDDERRREGDAELARASQEIVLVQEEASTLRRRLEQSGAEIGRLARSETHALDQAKAERARAMAMQTAAERAQAETLLLTRTQEERSEAARSELAVLGARLETATARAEKLESLNADLARRVADVADSQRHAERTGVETQLRLERANERIEQLDRELGEHRASQASLDAARAAAVDRGDQLTRTLQTQEVALRRAEERLRELQGRAEAAARQQEEYRRVADEQAAGHAGELQRLKTELTIAEAALQVARRERAHPAARDRADRRVLEA